MDLVEQIESFIKKDTDDFFEEPEIRDDLHVTIRIAKDFYDFLKRYDDNPPTTEIDYIMGTIRSGLDHFFSLAYICAIINTGSRAWSFDRQAQWDFVQLRNKFMRDFDSLAASMPTSTIDKLASLLVLVHLELVFMAQHFPFVIFSFPK